MKDEKQKNFPVALKKYLEDKGVDPKIVEHKTVYTAYDVANTLKRKLDEIVKTLLVKADNYYYVVCLPANQNLDFKKIQKAIEGAVGKKVKTVKIPSEEVMIGLLKLRKQGMSAFGGFHKLPVIAEKNLANLKKAIFSSGSFNHSIEMGAKQFIGLENAVLASFGINKKVSLIKKRPASSIKIKPRAYKTMATKKKAKKAAKKPVAKKKKAAAKKKK
jgi:prolyl-tRNA editing enzyme YbaK/EbsC (Cys-tRNA(Pro) deacylase)